MLVMIGLPARLGGSANRRFICLRRKLIQTHSLIRYHEKWSLVYKQKKIRKFQQSPFPPNFLLNRRFLKYLSNL